MQGMLGGIVCIALFTFGSEVYAKNEVMLTATVDRDHASLDEYIVLTIAVEGAREEPELPDMPAFKIQSRGSSSQISIVNGAVSSKVEFTYVLYPQKTGVFTLGPFTLSHAGSTITSNTITVTISQAPQPQQQEREELFVTAQVDTPQPYLYQQIICTFQFCRSVKVANANLTDQPSFEGFIVEDLGKPSEYQKIINGRQYLVTEIRKALFPIKSGVLEITPFTLQCEVVAQRSRRRGFFQDPFFNDPFFGFTETVPKTLRTQPVQVLVKPLPAEGRPPDFKNLVGNTTLSATLSKASVAAGESATLTLTLSGTGNLKNVSGIELPQIEKIKVYDDKPVYEQKIAQGKLYGTLTIKKALVPLEEGKISIPPISVSFFDPAEGTYKQATTQSFQLAVAGGQDKENATVVSGVPKRETVKQDIAVVGRDIMPVRTSLKALEPGMPMLSPLVIVLLMLLPVALFLSFVGIRRYREKATHDVTALRSRKAYSLFKKELSALKRAAQTDTGLFYQQASKAFRDFIGHKLGITGAALTSGELHDILRRAGVAEQTAADAARLLEFFDAGQFGVTKHDARERLNAYNSLQRLVKMLDRTLKTIQPLRQG